jgi:hypothetical protein
MDRAIGSDDSGTRRGAFLVPGFPTGGDVSPTVGAFLGEDFIKIVSGTDGAPLTIKNYGLLIFEKEHIGARGGGSF